MSVASLAALFSGARPDAHQVALRGGEVLALGRLRRDVAYNAARAEIRAARRALLVCDDGYAFLVGLFALLQAGVEIILPPNLQPGTLHQLADGCDLFLADVPPPPGAEALRLESGDAAPCALPPDFARRPIGFFTSGSTGAMKRIEKCLAQFEREATTLENQWGADMGGADVFGTVPHQHVFGMTFRLVWPLLSGRCFDATPHLAWEDLLGGLTPRAAIISSPAHLTRLDGLGRLPAERAPAMIFTAGAPLPARASRAAARLFGRAPVEIFGSTETGVIAWRSGAGDPACWQALPGVAVGQTEGGLLRVHSPFVAGDGRYDLADRVSLLCADRFRFEGRADRIAKIEGKRVSLPQVERELARLPWIAEAAVALVDAERPFLGAILVPTPAGKAELARLGKFRFERRLRQALARTQDPAVLPRRWRIVDRLPTDGMGKRRAAAILDLLEVPA